MNFLNDSSLFKAFEQVKGNHGCAGVDRVTVDRFEGNLDNNLSCLRSEVVAGRYIPFPLLKIMVDKGKGDGSARGLCIPAVRDRILQTAVLHIIGPRLETEFEDCSYAYRKGRSVRKAVHRIQEYYDQGYHWVVDADIDDFFDTVDHDLLLSRFRNHVNDPVMRRLVEQWLRAEVWDGSRLFTLEKGLPQGSPVSPVLANLFLDELDEGMLRSRFGFIRYSDDFIILCKNREDAEKALKLSHELLHHLKLTLDEEEITTFERGFTYLGVIFMRSLIMTPFERPPKKGVLHYPSPFPLQNWLLKHQLGR